MPRKRVVQVHVYVHPQWLRGFCDALGLEVQVVKKEIHDDIEKACAAVTPYKLKVTVYLESRLKMGMWGVIVYYDGRDYPKGVNIRGMERAGKETLARYFETLKGLA